MSSKQCKECIAKDPNAEICKHCKYFGKLKTEDIEIDWCFFQDRGGATASLYSCENFERKRLEGNFKQGEQHE